MILNSPTISGSLTVTGNILTSGSITLSGSIASASYAATASFVALAQSASYVLTAQTASFVANAQTASFVALAQSASNAVSAQTASFANAFTVAGNLTAQTLVVQTITSSVDFVTGSTRFGSILGNTHVFTGSILLNGSSSIQAVPNGVDEYYYLSAKGGYNTGFSIYEYSGNQYLNASGSMFLRYNNLGGTTGIFAIVSGSSEVLRITATGSVGIGTSSPTAPLTIAVPAVGSAIGATTSQQAFDYSRLRIKHYSDSNLGLSIGYAGANLTYIQSCYNEGTTAPLLINPFGGIVGIGTTPNTVQLDVKNTQTGTTFPIAAFRDNSTNQNALQIHVGNNESRFRAVYYGTPSDQSITFHTITSAGSEGERMRIRYDGNVGIGNNNPSSILEIQRDTNGDTPIIFVNGSGGSGNTNATITLDFRLRNGSGGSTGGVLLRAGKETDHIGTNVNDYFAISTTKSDSMAERVRITSGGVLRFSNVPFNNYHLDTSVVITVANGGTIPFETFSGLVLVNNMSNGNIGMWMVGAGNTVLVSQVYGVATGTMSYSSAINGYVWTSNFGSTANYGVFAVRTRANA